MNPKEYIKQAMVTCSPNFFGDKVPLRLYSKYLNDGIRAGDLLDVVKKSLFYGKDNAFGRTSTDEHLNSENEQQQQIIHGILGVFTEGAELLEALTKKFDPTNIKEEIGDVLWYLAILCYYLGTDFETEMNRNIAKLRERYKDKFSQYDAINRDLPAERRILENEEWINSLDNEKIEQHSKPIYGNE